MVTKWIDNERTALAQEVTRQPDGPGRRIGKRGELTGIGKVAPGGAKIFRERLPQFQAEAAYWENRIGTVHDFASSCLTTTPVFCSPSSSMAILSPTSKT